MSLLESPAQFCNFECLRRQIFSLLSQRQAHIETRPSTNDIDSIGPAYRILWSCTQFGMQLLLLSEHQQNTRLMHFQSVKCILDRKQFWAINKASRRSRSGLFDIQKVQSVVHKALLPTTRIYLKPTHALLFLHILRTQRQVMQNFIVVQQVLPQSRVRPFETTKRFKQDSYLVMLQH